MGKWIFQGNPKRYDVDQNFEEGEEETWLASRFREEMRDGDVVYFWRAGEQEKRGIYGWGVIEKDPQRHAGWGWGVDVRYVKRFPHHLAAEELASDPVFGHHLLFRMPAGTNHTLTEEEDGTLKRLIQEKFGEDFAPEENEE